MLFRFIWIETLLKQIVVYTPFAIHLQSYMEFYHKTLILIQKETVVDSWVCY